MDPRYEQMLRDEVIYLHSLWHRGPPISAAAAASRHHLQPTQSTQFKQEKMPKSKKRRKKSKTKPDSPTLEPNPSPGAEWHCPTPPPPTTTCWPSLSIPNSKPHLEEKSKSPAKLSHQRALEAVHNFFTQNSSDDDSDLIESSSSEEDNESLMEEDDKHNAYSFFLNMFMEDPELKEHYTKNFAQGVFSCLICGALGRKKMGKKYKDCLALVQHSITITKTKKRRAHRAFGQAVCKVLGWDIDQLPAVVSLLSENKSAEPQGNVNCDNKENSSTSGCNVKFVEGSVVPESEAIGSLLSENKSGEPPGNVNIENKESFITPVCNVVSIEGNNSGAVIESEPIVSLPSEHKSGKGSVNFDNKETSISSISNVDSIEGNNGVVMESGATASLLCDPPINPQESCSFDARESSSTVEDSFGGNNTRVVPEIGAIGNGIPPNGVEENKILARHIDMIWRSLQNKDVVDGLKENDNKARG